MNVGNNYAVYDSSLNEYNQYSTRFSYVFMQQMKSYVRQTEVQVAMYRYRNKVSL